jgi:purine catabolism regulator
MSLTIRDLFEDAYFFAAGPTVVAGFANLDDSVRWVHASEQRDIAPLLRGGELVLMEAVNLAEAVASDDERSAYLQSLHNAGVAALAIELTERMPAIPRGMVECATELGLPLITLKRRIPFVQICESINTQLADSSLVRLRLADSMSIVLSETVRELTAIPAMLAVLSEQTHAEVVLMSTSGEEIGRATGGGSPLRLSFSAPVSFGGTVVANLVLRPWQEADIYLINAALERAPELLAIALLQVRPPSDDERIAGQLFALLRTAPLDDTQKTLFDAFTDKLGIPADAAFLGVAVDLLGDTHTLPALRDLITSSAAGCLSELVGTNFQSVLWFSDRRALETARTVLRSRFTALITGESPAIVGIGPGNVGRVHIGRELAAARGAVEVSQSRSGGVVVDARELAVSRLIQALTPGEALESFLEEQLGALKAADPELVSTLVALISNWGSKTEAARALGVQRQTLHLRIKRIESVVGPLPAMGESTAPLVVAVLLDHAMQRPE